MIIDRWLDLPVWGIFASLALAFSLSAGIIYWASFGRIMSPRTSTLAGVVPPFFGAVAILFALLTGFLANDVWERNRLATRAVLAESDGILAVYAMSLAAVSDMSDVRTSVQAYARRLVEDEWPVMEMQESAPSAGAALDALLALVAHPNIDTNAGTAVQGALLDTALKLRSSRHDRLAMSGDRSDRTKWSAVLFLALVTQLAIAVVHLERPKAQVAALSIFSLAVVISLGLVAIRERPFAGPLRVSFEPIAQALEEMKSVPKGS